MNQVFLSILLPRLALCFIGSATMILTRASGFSPRDVTILRQSTVCIGSADPLDEVGEAGAEVS